MGALDDYINRRGALLQQKGEQQRQQVVSQNQQRLAAQPTPQQARQQEAGNARREATVATLVDAFTSADPASRPQILQRGVEMFTQMGDEEGAKFVSDFATLPPDQQELRAQGSLQDFQNRGIIDKPEVAKPKSTAAITNAQYLNNPDVPQALKDTVMAQIRKTGQRIEIGPDGNVTISEETIGSGDGDSGLSTPVKSGLQNKIISGKANLELLDQVEENLDLEALTYGGQISTTASRLKEKLGFDLTEEDQEKLRSKRKFIESIEGIFNAYRKDITGAAASVKELDRLKKSMLNADLSPSEFQASFDRFKNQITRTTKLYETLLKNGLSPSAAGKAVDASKDTGQAPEDDLGAMSDADLDAEIARLQSQQ